MSSNSYEPWSVEIVGRSQDGRDNYRICPGTSSANIMPRDVTRRVSWLTRQFNGQARRNDGRYASQQSSKAKILRM